MATTANFNDSDFDNSNIDESDIDIVPSLNALLQLSIGTGLLFASLFIAYNATLTLVMIQDATAGTTIAGIGALQGYSSLRKPWLGWLAAAMGLWVIAIPWTVGGLAAHSTVMRYHVALGLLTAVLGLFSAEKARRASR